MSVKSLVTKAIVLVAIGGMASLVTSCSAQQRSEHGEGHEGRERAGEHGERGEQRGEHDADMGGEGEGEEDGMRLVLKWDAT